MVSGVGREASRKWREISVAHPAMTRTVGNIPATCWARVTSRSIAANVVPSGSIAAIFFVKTPVPGPSSTMQRVVAMSADRTISSARAGEDGQIAPMVDGDRNKALINRRDMNGEGCSVAYDAAISKAFSFRRECGLIWVA